MLSQLHPILAYLKGKSKANFKFIVHFHNSSVHSVNIKLIGEEAENETNMMIMMMMIMMINMAIDTGEKTFEIEKINNNNFNQNISKSPSQNSRSNKNVRKSL
jgi:hypothetical protein